MPVGTILTNLINAYYTKVMYPDIVCEGSISKEMKADIKKRIFGLLSYKIYNIVYFSVDAIIISAFLGLKPLALYNNYIVVINAFVGFLSIIDSSLIAGIGNKMVTDTKENVYMDFKNYLFAYSWLSSFIAIFLASIFQNFMTVWLGKDFLLPMVTVMLMLLNFTLSRVVNTAIYTYRQAAGLWWEDRFRPIVQGIINLGLSLYLVNYFGINGVLLSTTFCTLFIAIAWGGRILFKYYFKCSMKEFYTLSIFYMTITVFVAIVCYYICNIMITSNTFFTLIIKTIITFFISNTLFFIFYRKLKELDYLKSKGIEAYRRFILKIS